jgi:ribulose-phosphate 3-epimerase
MQSKISPSMMCADLLSLNTQLEAFKNGGIEYLHIDIMDGVFVQNYTLGTDYIKNLRSLTDIPFDIHLMITEPEKKIDWFDIRPGDYVSVHYESTAHVQRALQAIKDKGARPMLAINPATPLCTVEDVADDLEGVLVMTVNPGFAGQKLIPQTLKKIARLRSWLDLNSYTNIEIEVDGNVSLENAFKMRQTGANIFVTGTSSIFVKGIDINESIKQLRNVISLT